MPKRKLSDVMATDPVTCQATDTVAQAAKQMRDRNVGDVLVMDGQDICGIVTDRDIVVRAIAQGKHAEQTPLGDICSHDLQTLATTSTVDEAIDLMRRNAVRRLPVMEGKTPVGIVSLGDLAQERDPQSVLGQVSAAPSNK